MQVKLIAHRGYAARFPENTLIGIEAAIKAGAEFVEVDVQLAADGTPMLFHDRTLDRMCGVNGAIADYSPQQLSRLEASEPGRFGETFAGTPIATLEALAGLIRQHPRVHFFIELKCESIERFNSPMVLEHTQLGLTGLEEMCTLISFSVEAIGLAKARGLSTGLILENWTQGQSLHTPPEYLFCNIRHLPTSGRLHIPGTKLAIYEVADAELTARLTARGVDFVETFSIGEMRAALSKF